MTRFVRPSRAPRTSAAVAIVWLSVAGCDSGDAKADGASGAAAEPSKSDAPAEAQAPAEKESGAAAKADPADPAGPGAGVDPNGPSLDARVTFSVDGEAKTFEYVPSKSAMVSSFNTSFQAKPEGGSTERLAISIASFDPSKAELPATLSFDPGKAARAGSPKKLIAAAKPMVVYRSPDGKKFAAQATLQIDSFADGRLVGKIDDITLAAPNDTDHGSVELSNAAFSVKLR